MNFLQLVFARIVAIPRNFIVISGLLLLCAGPVLGAFTERIELAIAITFASTLVGTSILGLYLPKLLAPLVTNEREKTKILEGKLAAESALLKANKTILDAEREIARLERMQMALQSIKPIAKLGLLEVEMIVKDFRTCDIGSKHLPKLVGIPIGKERQVTYVGAVEIPVKAHIGIDLNNVRIREDRAGRLIVGGVHISTTCEAGHANWLLNEVRTVYFRDNSAVKIDILPGDVRLLAERDDHEKQLRQRISAGATFSPHVVSPQQTYQEVLTSILAPFGKEVIFVEDAMLEAGTLLTYLKGINDKLTSEIEKHRNMVREFVPEMLFRQ